jgi:hypothetical protein
LEDKVNKRKQFALHIAAAAMLIGTSAFAESRHSDATARDGSRAERGNRGSIEQRGDRADHRDAARSTVQQQRTETRSNDNRSNDTRSYDRNRGNDTRSYDRNRGNDNRSYDRNRGYDNNRGNDNRSYDRNRGYSPSYSRGNAYYHDGRVSRIERWNGGFRIYVGGARYPFFVPEARFRLFPFRVGLSIHIGGYYNPLGYYDYYDAGPYGPGAVASAGGIRGLVESVDYRRGSLVIRDDVSGQFVTVMMRGGDPRFDSLRTGDYVDLSGEWVRGYFQAYNVDRIDDGYYRR